MKLIVTNCRETTTWAAKGMLNRELLATHTQLKGNSGGHQPYRRHKALRKAPLCRQKPCSVRGRAVTQLEECFSKDNMMDLYNDGDSIGSKASRESMIDW